MGGQSRTPIGLLEKAGPTNRTDNQLLKLGGIEFSGEGEKDWVASQLHKILEKAPVLVNLVPAPSSVHSSNDSHNHSHKPMGADPMIAQQTLSTFLKEKNATTNQVKKFLATAVWLEAKGKNKMTTSEVSRALKDSQQTKLANPSDCLNQNVKKGYCEKDGKEFFVTVEGKNSL